MAEQATIAGVAVLDLLKALQRAGLGPALLCRAAGLSVASYRANVAPQAEAPAFGDLPRVQAPTLGVWSTGDHHLVEAGMTRSAEQVAGPWRYERIGGAGHRIPLDAPDRLNGLLREFFRGGAS
jgi:pimeloyl-ACP methyl ester carboxylesterase